MAIAAVSLAACGRKEAAPQRPAVEVTKDGYTIRSKDGSATMVTGKSAADAKTPAFAPLFPGAKVESSVAGIGNDKADGGTLVYKVAARPEAVIAFYRQKAAAEGFETQMDSNMGAAHMFAAGDETSGKALQVIASDADGGTSVQVIWATKK